MGCDPSIYDCATNGATTDIGFTIAIIVAFGVYLFHVVLGDRGLPKD